MDQPSRNTSLASPLAQLLGGVMILSVLAAVAVPTYVGLRRTAAARACQSNIAAITRAEMVYAMRHGGYSTRPMESATGLAPGLVGASQGLSRPVTCPLGQAEYRVSLGPAGALTIACPNAAAHEAVAPARDGYARTLPAQGPETIP